MKGKCMKSVLNLGYGYKIKATRKSVGSFEVVSIDWQHPNYGYFTDAILWIFSPHIETWCPVPIVNWSKKYKNLELFLQDYPELSNFFENVDQFKEIRLAIMKTKV